MNENEVKEEIKFFKKLITLYLCSKGKREKFREENVSLNIQAYKGERSES